MCNNTVYDNISFEGTVVGNAGVPGNENTSRSVEVGGLIGAGEFGGDIEIKNNEVKGTLSASAVSSNDLNVTAGGIIGDAYFKDKLTSYSLTENETDLAISVSQTEDAKLNVGGLVGKMYNATQNADPSLVITFKDCHVSGSINVESTVQGSDKECYVGGLLGAEANWSMAPLL